MNADRLNEIRKRWQEHRATTLLQGAQEDILDLLAALDAAEQQAARLEQRIERQRIELAGANDRNRRGNEFARKEAEARATKAEKELAALKATLAVAEVTLLADLAAEDKT